jgi:hypothetical protein
MCAIEKNGEVDSVLTSKKSVQGIVCFIQKLFATHAPLHACVLLYLMAQTTAVWDCALTRLSFARGAERVHQAGNGAESDSEAASAKRASSAMRRHTPPTSHVTPTHVTRHTDARHTSHRRTSHVTPTHVACHTDARHTSH